MPQSQQEADKSVRMRISDAAVRVLREHTGRGATTARTMVDNHAVVVFLHDCLTKGENVLVAHDMDEQVLELRRSFQETMRTDLIPAIEEIVGRKVTSFLSANSIDPDLMVEVFVLGPPVEDAPAADAAPVNGAASALVEGALTVDGKGDADGDGGARRPATDA